MKSRILLLVFLLTFLVGGCSPLATASQPQTEPVPAGQKPDPARPTLTGLNRDGLISYSSTFEIQFEGAVKWTYQLKTRKTSSLREINLHIEGITGAANPGDVRLVTDGTTTRMIGPGTEQECMQYPNHQGMDPTLAYPELLVSFDKLPGLLTYTGEDNIAGKDSAHFSGSALTPAGWKDAKIEVWQDTASQALMKFTMQASGVDPFFDSGAGKLTAHYWVEGLNDAAIEPVKGCEISVPLPDSAKNFVRLPGMASFESQAGVDEMRSFYQAQLQAGNWVENQAPAQAEGGIVLSYRRDAEEVEIHIEAVPAGGCKVKLLFLPVG